MLHFSENIYTYGSQSMMVDELIFSGRSDYQDVLLFWNQFYGHVLVLDGVLQLTERDEFIYSEMMAHVPLFAHPDPASVLIIGGGDGCVLEEVLKHKAVRRAVLVDIDGLAVDLCRRHFAARHGSAFEDPRLELRVADGIAYVRDAREKFDLILVDGPDQTGAGEAGSSLYTNEFCRHCASLLKPGGMMVIQSDVPFHNPQSLALTCGLVETLFPTKKIYTAPVPAYLGGLMCFVCAAGPGVDFTAPLRAGWQIGDIPDLRYYTPAIHTAAFQLPPYIEAIAGKPAELAEAL
jgi:spermidine synthase